MPGKPKPKAKEDGASTTRRRSERLAAASAARREEVVEEEEEEEEEEVVEEEPVASRTRSGGVKRSAPVKVVDEIRKPAASKKPKAETTAPVPPPVEEEEEVPSGREARANKRAARDTTTTTTTTTEGDKRVRKEDDTKSHGSTKTADKFAEKVVDDFNSVESELVNYKRHYPETSKFRAIFRRLFQQQLSVVSNVSRNTVIEAIGNGTIPRPLNIDSYITNLQSYAKRGNFAPRSGEGVKRLAAFISGPLRTAYENAPPRRGGPPPPAPKPGEDGRTTPGMDDKSYRTYAMDEDDTVRDDFDAGGTSSDSDSDDSSATPVIRKRGRAASSDTKPKVTRVGPEPIRPPSPSAASTTSSKRTGPKSSKRPPPVSTVEEEEEELKTSRPTPPEEEEPTTPMSARSTSSRKSRREPEPIPEPPASTVPPPRPVSRSGSPETVRSSKSKRTISPDTVRSKRSVPVSSSSSSEEEEEELGGAFGGGAIPSRMDGDPPELTSERPPSAFSKPRPISPKSTASSTTSRKRSAATPEAPREEPEPEEDPSSSSSDEDDDGGGGGGGGGGVPAGPIGYDKLKQTHQVMRTLFAYQVEMTRVLGSIGYGSTNAMPTLKLIYGEDVTTSAPRAKDLVEVCAYIFANYPPGIEPWEYNKDTTMDLKVAAFVLLNKRGDDVTKFRTYEEREAEFVGLGRTTVDPHMYFTTHELEERAKRGPTRVRPAATTTTTSAPTAAPKRATGEVEISARTGFIPRVGRKEGSYYVVKSQGEKTGLLSVLKQRVPDATERIVKESGTQYVRFPPGTQFREVLGGILGFGKSESMKNYLVFDGGVDGAQDLGGGAYQLNKVTKVPTTTFMAMSNVTWYVPELYVEGGITRKLHTICGVSDQIGIHYEISAREVKEIRKTEVYVPKGSYLYDSDGNPYISKAEQYLNQATLFNSLTTKGHGMGIPLAGFREFYTQNYGVPRMSAIDHDQMARAFDRYEGNKVVDDFLKFFRAPQI